MENGERESIMDAVLDTNWTHNMAPFLPPSDDAAFLGTKMVPSMRHHFKGGILLPKKGAQNATISRYITESLLIYDCFLCLFGILPASGD
jgi:hypothetical protein